MDYRIFEFIDSFAITIPDLLSNVDFNSIYFKSIFTVNVLHVFDFLEHQNIRNKKIPSILLSKTTGFTSNICLILFVRLL